MILGVNERQAAEQLLNYYNIISATRQKTNESTLGSKLYRSLKRGSWHKSNTKQLAQQFPPLHVLQQRPAGHGMSCYGTNQDLLGYIGCARRVLLCSSSVRYAAMEKQVVWMQQHVPRRAADNGHPLTSTIAQLFWRREKLKHLKGID